MKQIYNTVPHLFVNRGFPSVYCVNGKYISSITPYYVHNYAIKLKQSWVNLDVLPWLYKYDCNN